MDAKLSQPVREGQKVHKVHKKEDGTGPADLDEPDPLLVDLMEFESELVALTARFSQLRAKVTARLKKKGTK